MITFIHGFKTAYKWPGLFTVPKPCIKPKITICKTSFCNYRNIIKKYVENAPTCSIFIYPGLGWAGQYLQRDGLPLGFFILHFCYFLFHFIPKTQIQIVYSRDPEFLNLSLIFESLYYVVNLTTWVFILYFLCDCRTVIVYICMIYLLCWVRIC